MSTTRVQQGRLFLDSSIWAIAFASAVLVRYKFNLQSVCWAALALACLFAVLFQLVVGGLLFRHWYSVNPSKKFSREMVEMLVMVLLTGGALGFAILLLSVWWQLPRSALLLAIPVAFGLSVGLRYLSRIAARRKRALWSRSAKRLAWRGALGIVAGALTVALATTLAAVPWGWPEPRIPEGTEAEISQQRAIWEETPFPYESYFAQHTAVGDYLKMGRGDLCTDSDGRVDRVAKKVVSQGETAEFHPVLSAQCGLKAYGRVTRGVDVEEATKSVLLYAESLISLQDEIGAFRYPFEFHYYLTKENLPVGWVSGMAQGQALSLLGRAFELTQDQRFLDAGELAVQFMGTRVEDGGVMTDLTTLGWGLKDFIFFEEYVSDPPNYTLNGFMFALLGLYDWSLVPGATAGQQESAELFKGGIKTLEKMLPYYDLGSISAYDLGFMTFEGKLPHIAARYHGVHIYLLHAMYSITANRTFQDYENLWISYFDATDAP